MPRPTALFAAILVLALTASGAALAGDRTTVRGEAAGGATVYTVADAGSVTLAVEESSIVIRALTPAPGWAATIDSQTATEVQVDFTTVGQSITFDAELEDGSIRARIEDRTGIRLEDRGDDDAATPPATTTSTTLSPPTPDTDDRSGPGHGDDDEGDHSGPGRGEDDRSTTAASEAGLGSELGLRTVSIPGMGTITVEVEAGSVAFVSAQPAPGWSAGLDDASGGEVEVAFTSGEVEVDVELEIDDGRLRLEVEADD